MTKRRRKTEYVVGQNFTIQRADGKPLQCGDLVPGQLVRVDLTNILPELTQEKSP